MIRTIELVEYGEAEVTLSLDELAELQVVAGAALSFAPSASPGRWSVKAGGTVGTIVTPTVRFLIRPKVSAANLFHMLEPDGKALAVDAASFDYAESDDLLSAFATFFARVLEPALARGIPRQYREESGRLMAVRGRIDVAAQVRRGLPAPIDCRFDEYSVDTQLNRLLRSACLRLGLLPGVPRTTRHALRTVSDRLDGAGLATRADLERATPFTRLDRHLQASERLARLALQGASITDRSGSTGAGSFLINMPWLFETFVEHRLRRALRGSLQVVGQFRTHLDHGRSVAMRPDLVFLRDEEVVGVADCKYKLAKKGLGRESDYYQLLAYCTSLGLPNGLLIYAQADGEPPATTVDVRGTDARLRLTALSLAGQPSELDEAIDGLATSVEEGFIDSSS